jgi:hypothetical protein
MNAPVSVLLAVADVWDVRGLPALYLVLYLGTLCLHAVLMSYVLAGSGYVAAATVLGARDRDPVARVLADWLPFGLGLAITAGVAPLLFLQILYKESFYTANLLLFHRWMAVVPVLIVGFYLLYVGKSETARAWGRPARAAAAVIAFVCFGFAAWSWTGNHLVALERARWVELYLTRGIPAPSPAMLFRLAMWLAGSVPIMAMIVGWQLRHRAERSADGSGERSADGSGDGSTDGPGVKAGVDDDVEADGRARRRLAVLALAGIALAMGFGYGHARLLDPSVRAVLASPGALAYLVPLGLGLALQAGAWLALARGPARSGAWSRPALIVAALGAVLAVSGTSLAREAVRLAALDVHGPGLAAVADAQARAASSGGIVAFFVFLAINTALIAWCLRATRRALAQRS